MLIFLLSMLTAKITLNVGIVIEARIFYDIPAS